MSYPGLVKSVPSAAVTAPRKDLCILSVRDILLRFNGCRVFMSLVGLGILLAYGLSQ
jgi:hypothetical protein